MAKPNGNRFRCSRPLADDAVGPDPVSLYLREIVQRPLLNAAEERELGRQILEGRAALRTALNRIPYTARHVIALADRLVSDGVRLGDVVRLGGDEPRERLDEIRSRTLASVDRIDRLLGRRRVPRPVDAERVAELLDGMELADRVHDDALQALEEFHVSLRGRRATSRNHGRDAARRCEEMKSGAASAGGVEERDQVELTGLPAEDLATRMREIRRIVRRIEAVVDRFVESNLRLVVAIAKGYTHRGLALLDLVQEGNLGLMRAVRKFDHRLGFRFATYGSHWIKQSMSLAIGRNTPVHVPGQASEDARRVRAAMRASRCEEDSEPSLEDLSALTGLGADRIGELLAVMRQPRSLDESLNEEGAATYGDSLADWRIVPTEGAAEGGDMDDKTDRVLATLPPREQIVLRLRFGMGDHGDHGLAEIGERFGVSRERVRQLEAKALAMLRRSHPGEGAGLRRGPSA